MDNVDTLKYTAILSEHVQQLKFLGLINTQDDASSELAGYEISKLLNEQRKLESSYADLIQRRSTLVGIANKKNLLLIQKDISEVAKNLKESTKKLVRLFKENPDLESDALKVRKERVELMEDLEKLQKSLLTDSYQEFQGKVMSELENQDLLRKYTNKEKKLVTDIKKIQAERNLEQKEYQNEINERQKTIQSHKEKLIYKTNRAEIKKKYDKKEAKANEGTSQRIYDYSLKELEGEIDRLRNKISTENLVHEHLKDYLRRKNKEITDKADEWSRKNEDNRNKMDDEKEKLTKQRDQDMEKLEKLRKRFADEQFENLMKEQEEIKKSDDAKKKEEHLKRMDNAIKYIQNAFNEWIEAGGGKKRPKKKAVKKK